MADERLYWYVCRPCGSSMTCSIPQGKAYNHGTGYARCNGCRGWMRFSHSIPIETDEHRAWAKAGRLYHAVPTPLWTCARCGKESRESGRTRADGRVCYDCYKAEQEPPPPLLTPEQIAEKQRARAEALRRMDEEHERGCAEAEAAAHERSQVTR